MRDIVITVELELERDDDRFHASAPALKGLHADGASEAEAIEAAREAVREYIMSLIKHGDPLPVGCNVAVKPSGEVVHARARQIPAKSSRLVTTQVHCPA